MRLLSARIRCLIHCEIYRTSLRLFTCAGKRDGSSKIARHLGLRAIARGTNSNNEGDVAS